MRVPLGSRPVFTSDHGVHLSVFLVLSIVTLGVAVGLAFFLNALFRWGHYYILLVPIAAGFAVAGCVLGTVWLSHCRNRWLAAGLGLLAGVVLYIGQYHIRFLDVVGWDQWRRVDALPSYIKWEIQHRRLRDSHRSRRPEDEDSRPRTGLDLFMNGMVFVWEMGVVLGFGVAVGWLWAGRAYCPRHRRWMTHKEVHLPKGSSAALQGGIRTDTLLQLVQQPLVIPTSKTPVAVVMVEYCAREPSPGVPGYSDSCPVYFTLRETPFKRVVARARLYLEEIQILGRHFPALGGGSRTVEGFSTPFPESSSWAPGREEFPGSSRTVSLPDVRVEPLSGPNAGQVLRMPHTLAANLLTLVILIGLLLGPVLGILGGSLLEAAHKSGSPAGAQEILGYILIAIGVPLLIVVCVLGLTRTDVLTAWYYRRRVRRELAGRPDALVSPEDPEALFVRVVPRGNIAKPMLEDATDIGYLRLDERAREIRFEGDCERYRIPLRALHSFTLEGVALSSSAIQIRRWFLILTCDVGGRVWEAPVTVCGLSGRRKKKALEGLVGRLTALRAGSGTSA